MGNLQTANSDLQKAHSETKQNPAHKTFMRTNPEAQHFYSMALHRGKRRQYRHSNNAGLNQGQSECREHPIFSPQLVSIELKDAQQCFNGVGYVGKCCKALYCKVAQTAKGPVKFSDLSRFGIFFVCRQDFRGTHTCM